jgi:hypothetical protein
MSNFIFQLIRSRTARQITGDRNNYTETTLTESAYWPPSNFLYFPPSRLQTGAAS